MSIRRLACDLTPVRARSSLSGVFHCTPWKAGSQVVRAVLFDPAVYRWSGLVPDHVYGTHGGIYRETRRPSRHLSSPIFGTPAQLAAIDPDWKDQRAVLAVVRHPADLLDSWYRANLYSHDPNPDVIRRRRKLVDLPYGAGLAASADDEFDQIVEIMCQWSFESSNRDRVFVFRFEDLFGRAAMSTWSALLDAADIRMPRRSLESLLGRYAVGAGERLRGLGEKYSEAGLEVRRRRQAVSLVVERYGDLLGCLPYE
jgi:hypothetical protein